MRPQTENVRLINSFGVDFVQCYRRFVYASIKAYFRIFDHCHIALPLCLYLINFLQALVQATKKCCKTEFMNNSESHQMISEM